jgi:hypothetical protein
VEHETKGYRTRNNKRTQTMIVSRRKEVRLDHGTLSKEGSVRGPPPGEEGRKGRASDQGQEADQDLVAPLDDPARTSSV